jgi:hypothetical protein
LGKRFLAALALGLEQSCIRPVGAVVDRWPRWVARVGFPALRRASDAR